MRQTNRSYAMNVLFVQRRVIPAFCGIYTYYVRVSLDECTHAY